MCESLGCLLQFTSCQQHVWLLRYSVTIPKCENIATILLLTVCTQVGRGILYTYQLCLTQSRFTLMDNNGKKEKSSASPNNVGILLKVFLVLQQVLALTLAILAGSVSSVDISWQLIEVVVLYVEIHSSVHCSKLQKGQSKPSAGDYDR